MPGHDHPRGSNGAGDTGSLGRASEWEYRHRRAIIFGIILAGFSLYRWDEVNGATALLHRLAPSLDTDGESGPWMLHVYFGVGAALCGIAALARTFGAAYLGPEVVSGAELQTDTLKSDGPYGHVRNPLYLGSLLLMAGVATLASTWGALLIVVAGSCFHLRLMGREEAALGAAHGEAYRRYCARVPRLLPSPARRVHAVAGAEVAPRWMAALAGEAFCWSVALAMLVFSVSLNAALLAYAMGAAFAIDALARIGRRLRAR